MNIMDFCSRRPTKVDDGYELLTEFFGHGPGDIVKIIAHGPHTDEVAIRVFEKDGERVTTAIVSRRILKMITGVDLNE